MTLNYNVTGSKRKELVSLIANFTGCEAHYKGAPSLSKAYGTASQGLLPGCGIRCPAGFPAFGVASVTSLAFTHPPVKWHGSAKCW